MDASYYQKYEPLFGSWYIVRELGQGAFGCVYEAQRRDYGTYRAALKAITIPQNKSEIKTIMSDGMDEESVHSYFKSFVDDVVEEFELMSKLKGHSNIVSYEDHMVIEHKDKIGWDILIRMELLTPLLDYEEKNKLSQNDVIRLGIDICKALELCRRYNIIHRDIKPENIFISDSGDFKLGDFGIARTVEKTSSGLSKKGTYTYMAPEVYTGAPYNETVDIYSLGIVLYRMLNNRRTPFLPPAPERIWPDDREAALTRRIRGEIIPPPINSSKSLSDIVLKACAYNPKDRYRTAAEMRGDLETVLYGKKLVADNDEELGAVVFTADSEHTVTSDKALSEETEYYPVSPDKTETRFSKTVKQDSSDANAKSDISSEAKTTQVYSDSEKKKKRILFGAAAVVILSLIICTFAFFSSGSSDKKNTGFEDQIEWTDWLTELPNGVNKEKFDIEEKTLYRSREKEIKSSDKKTMDGWELLEAVEEGEFGPWSQWSASKISSSPTRDVEQQTRYRCRDLESTTSTSSTKSGWELVKTTPGEEKWGSWSAWSTNAATASLTRKVETKTQYSFRTVTSSSSSDWGNWGSWTNVREETDANKQEQTRNVWGYYYYECSNCGAHMPSPGECQSSIGGCGNSNISSSNYHETWVTTSWDNAGFRSIGGYSAANINGETVYKSTSSESPRAQYRYRTKGAAPAEYSEWSEYSDTPISASSTKEVRTRTVYRYRDCTTTTVYHYQRWGDWSSWSTQTMSATSNKQVESQVFYRHRDKSTEPVYYFYKWGEWSDYADVKIVGDENVQVETQTQYRFKLNEHAGRNGAS